MADELVAKEIEIYPVRTSPACGAANDSGVEVFSFFEIMDFYCQMKWV